METNEQGTDIKTDDLEGLEPILDDSGNDVTDWKALAHKNNGIARRYKTDSQKTKEDFEAYKQSHPDIKEPEKKQDKKEFDLVEETYLLANGVKEEEFPLFLKESVESGLSIKQLLKSNYFQEKREMFNTAEAIPVGGGNRGGGASRNEVDYWMKKGQFPPNTPENKEIRRKLKDALVKRDSEGSKFSPNPIV